MSELSKIEDAIAANKMKAPAVFTQMRQIIQRQKEEIEALRGFAKTVVDASPDSADELLAIMLEHNILTPCMYLEPCCDDCQCWENGKEFPNPCYRRTPLLTGEPHDQ